MNLKVQVECHSGIRADERPVRYRVHGEEHVIEEVLQQWYGPEHQYFLVRTNGGSVDMLRHPTSIPDGEWEIVSFREPCASW